MNLLRDILAQWLLSLAMRVMPESQDKELYVQHINPYYWQRAAWLYKSWQEKKPKLTD